MEILSMQFLSVDSLLSYKTRTAYPKMESLIKHLYQSTAVLGYEVSGDIMFRLTENDARTENPILDLEFLIPINKEFESSEYYVYKPKFKLENALRIRHIGSYATLNNTKEKLWYHLIKKNMMPITDFYYLIRKNDISSVIDIYVGINGNIV